MCSPRMRFAGLLAAASQAAREAGVGGGAADPAAALGLEGMDPEVMNRQAQQIWSMLDDMANNNPTVRRAHAHSSARLHATADPLACGYGFVLQGYSKFVAKQSEDAELVDHPHIFPKKGFCAKTTYTPPGDTTAIRVFVNVCHHVAVRIVSACADPSSPPPLTLGRPIAGTSTADS